MNKTNALDMIFVSFFILIVGVYLGAYIMEAKYNTLLTQLQATCPGLQK